MRWFSICRLVFMYICLLLCLSHIETYDMYRILLIPQTEELRVCGSQVSGDLSVDGFMACRIILSKL